MSLRDKLLLSQINDINQVKCAHACAINIVYTTKGIKKELKSFKPFNSLTATMTYCSSFLVFIIGGIVAPTIYNNAFINANTNE